ncbi:transposase [Chryseobacterium sp. RU33C]|uniref:transposase n=1 Tax=Chryseobacterium sp. RU33C TaxID=1907398 RepID=UPI0009FB53D8
MGWFYRFKLHVFTNNKGRIIDCKMNAVNGDNRNPLQYKTSLKLYGKWFEDKG